MDLRTKVLETLASNEISLQVKEELLVDLVKTNYKGYQMEEEGLQLYKVQLYILYNSELRRLVLDELHQTPYSINPGY